MSNSSISGNYYGGVLDSEPYTAFSTFDFNGAGAAVYSELSISGNDPDADVEFPYSVGSDGRLTIGGSTLGAVSPDSSVVVYAKTDLNGDLSLGVLVNNP